MRVMFMFSEEKTPEILEKLPPIGGEKHQVWITMPVGFGAVQEFVSDKGDKKTWAGLLTDDDVGQIAAPLTDVMGEEGERVGTTELAPEQLRSLLTTFAEALVATGKPITADLIIESPQSEE